MALDATVAGAAAESYLSVVAADALAAADLSTDPEVANWLSGTTSAVVKEQALRRATAQVDAALATSWLPYSGPQALWFPRSIDYTTILGVATPLIPTRVQRATFAQAKYLLKNIRVLAAARTRQARDMQSASEPNTSYSQADDAGSSELSSEATQYLAPYVQARSGNGLRSVRMGSPMPGALAW